MTASARRDDDCPGDNPTGAFGRHGTACDTGSERGRIRTRG